MDLVLRRTRDPDEIRAESRVLRRMKGSKGRARRKLSGESLVGKVLKRRQAKCGDMSCEKGD
jgi:hypothetical protein